MHRAGHGRSSRRDEGGDEPAPRGGLEEAHGAGADAGAGPGAAADADAAAVDVDIDTDIYIGADAE